MRTPVFVGSGPLLALAALGLGGCVSEGLEIYDLEGKIILSREAATAVFKVDDGSGGLVDDVVEDVRLIGPVYLGLYPEIDYNVELFPHPSVAPSAYLSGGDAYPYGGTTIGDFRNACLEDLACKVVSGRYDTYQSLVDWWGGRLDRPLRDVYGNDIQIGEFIQQNCFDLMELTSDEEVRIIPTEDRNGDGNIDAGDLDFVQNADGDWEAEFRVWEAEFFKGFSAWAFIDTLGSNFGYSTCDPNLGYQEFTYNRSFRTGAQFQDVLNTPRTYLDDGDWVASLPFIWNNPQELAEVVIDFKVGTDDIGPLRDAALAAQEEAP